jgi:hypothetical protein
MPMLDLDKEDSFEATHPETGVGFTLRPVDPRTYERLQKRAGKERSGAVDAIAFSGLFAAHAIIDWRGVKQECTEANRKRFGEKFAFSVTPWIINQSMDAARSLDAEVEDAKNG